MTALYVILWSMGFVIIAGGVRRRAGSALTDIIVLIFLFAVIAVVDLVLRRFVYTGDTGWTLAAILAVGLALDALYGLMAPERQRQRNRRLRELMRGRRRA